MVCLDVTREKLKQVKKMKYDYKNIKLIELAKYVKDYNYNNILESDPTSKGPMITKMLKKTFERFVQKKEKNNKTQLTTMVKYIY